jgi:hypothetical protein
MYLIITLLTNFIWLTSVDNFDFDQVSKDFKLFRDEYPRLEKSQRINFKTVNTSRIIIRQKTDLKIY